MRVLDISSGTGGGTQYLSQFAAEIVGVEPDERYVKAAQQAYGGPKFIHGDSSVLREMPEFDLAISLHTLEHVADDESFLRDVHGCLRTDGRLILEVPLLLPIPMGMPLLPFHDREYLADELMQLLEQSGFRVTKAWGVSRNMYVDPELAREAIAIVATRSDT